MVGSPQVRLAMLRVGLGSCPGWWPASLEAAGVLNSSSSVSDGGVSAATSIGLPSEMKPRKGGGPHPLGESPCTEELIHTLPTLAPGIS